MKAALPAILHAKRIGPTLRPDHSRVLLRPFRVSGGKLARRIVNRVLTLPETEVERLLEHVQGDFGNRHRAIDRYFLARFREVEAAVGALSDLSPARQLLLGAYFTNEYSPESAALFNPSIVAHPDQTDVPPGALRFILSLRATGEGHISSITFRAGLISAQHRVSLQPPVAFAVEPDRVPNATYDAGLFARKLEEAGVRNRFSRAVLDRLPDAFTSTELHRALEQERRETGENRAIASRAARGMLLLAESNYEVRFDPLETMSQRVIFPASPSQSNGIEDARFVRFQEDDGRVTYYATYTAYDGKIILPQLLETEDFTHFKFLTLNGPAAQNKGMALFPRRIKGRYAMLSRQDDENILLMFSDHLHFWENPRVLLAPAEPWEFIKIGNCGSPIETPAGWLVLSHGVGAMRQYSLGAFLLDLEDPTRVLKRLRRPLLTANEAEREGYVPNVVYTCGAILHRGVLIIPYAMSDSATSFATIALEELLQAME